MKTIDRYVVRSFMFSYLVVLVGFLGLAVIIDASMNVDEFMEDVPAGLPALTRAARLLGVMGNWYAVRVLLFFQLLMPIITVVAAVVTVVTMKRRNEFVPLLASGVSVYRALWPVMVLALLASGLGMLNQEVALPRMAHRLVRRPDDPQGRLPQRVATGFTDTAGNHISADTYVAFTHTLDTLSIYGPITPTGRVTITADHATWDESRQGWLLDRGHIHRFDPSDAALPVEPFGPDLPTPPVFFETSLRPAEVDRPKHMIQLSGAGDLARRIVLRPDVRSLRVELHSRYVVPLHAIILLLLGLPLVLMQESKSVIVGLGIALIICLTYLGVQFVSEQMGSSGRLDPILAVWLPIFIFGPVAILLFDGIRT